MAWLRWGFVCLVLVVFGACSDPGSEDNLAAQLDRIPVPAEASEIRERYTECTDDGTRSVCPMLVRWYRIDGDTDPVRDAFVQRLEDVGLQVTETTEEDRIGATDGDYTFFVTFNVGAVSSADQVPSDIDLEVSVGPVPSFE